jgi:hypothetical protein
VGDPGEADDLEDRQRREQPDERGEHACRLFAEEGRTGLSRIAHRNAGNPARAAAPVVSMRVETMTKKKTPFSCSPPVI